MAGFSSITGQESIMNADNASFDGTERSGAMTTNGEMWIGSTALPHVKKGTITSPDGSVTVGYSDPNLTLQVAGGTTTGKTITGNTGGALSPTAGNWNIPGTNSALNGYSPWTSGSASNLTVNMPGTVKWVVNLTANLGTHTTIQAAITAAASGDDVFITPGTYTENLTLKAGVNLVAYMGDGNTPNVTISGNATATFAGACSISNIRLQTNSANLLTVSGSSATIVNLNNCYLNCSNNTGISYSSSSSSSAINCFNCLGNLGTTGIAYYSMSSAGNLMFYNCPNFSNTGASTTASSNSAGTVFFQYSIIQSPVSTSSTGTISSIFSVFQTSAINTTSLTTAGTSTPNAAFCYFFSGSASAISIGAGTTLSLTSCSITSTATNAITGAGTLNFSAVAFTGTSTYLVNTTTQTGGTIQGIRAGNAPSAGYLGERIEAKSGNVNIASSTNVVNVTSISLTAGIWDISAIANFAQTGATTVLAMAISTVSATIPSTAGDAQGNFTVVFTAGQVTLSVPSLRATLSATTTYYLCATSTFSTGVSNVNVGRISATRVG